MRLGAAAVGVFLLAAANVEAQVARGVVRLASTGDPVGGTYVVLLNQDSLEVTRALTNPLGQFTISAPSPGSYRVRTEQIGYRSAVSEPFVLADGATTELQLVVEPVIVRLDALLVEGLRECRVVGEQALEVLAVWDEARKVLAAVRWGELQEEFLYDLERFERWYSPTFRLVNERRYSTPTRNVMPFRSRSVEELEENGYVVVEDDSVLYEAPDAEVFFSESFLQNHCFWLDEQSRGSGQAIGLRFEPVTGRNLPDVMGVFWLDRATGALERLELSYVNVGLWQRERGAAADVEFSRLPDGRWFVSRWWIRMPMVQRVESLKGPVWDLAQAVVGFEEEGGEVRRVFVPDGRTLYARGRASVRGLVYDSTAGRGLANAYVRLVGTERATISDVDGSYWLADLPEGRYAVTFEHPRAALFGPTDEVEVELDVSQVTAARLTIPTGATLVGRLCQPRRGEAPPGLLVGRVRDAEQDTIVPGASIRIVWLSRDAAGDRLLQNRAVADSSGIYRACVPRDAPLSVELMEGDSTVAAVSAVFGERWLRTIDVVRRPPEESDEVKPEQRER